jgi:hypothetical protein
MRELDRLLQRLSHFSLHNMLELAKTDVCSHWTTLFILSDLCSLDQSNHPFQAYVVSIEEMNIRREERCSALLEGNNEI